MNCVIPVFAFFLSACVGGAESPAPTQATADYGNAIVSGVLRVDSQSRIYCDIAGWPAIVGKEMPVQIRGLAPTESGFSVPMREFVMQTLQGCLNRSQTAGDPNLPASGKIQLTHITRGSGFCLVADIQADGKDLGQLLIDKGFAQKILTPVGSSVPPAQADPDTPAPASAANEPSKTGYAASKNSQTFHRADCRHAKRILKSTLLVFETREQAIQTGRKPCKVCNP